MRRGPIAHPVRGALVACGALVVVVFGQAGIAHADRKAALMYYRAGEKAYQAQSFAAAAQNFDQAYQELPLPEIAFSAAQAYRRQYRVEPKRDYVERAVALYHAYLDKVKSGGRVGDAADSLGEMERELDRLGARKGTTQPAAAETTRLMITVVLDGASADGMPMKEIEDHKVGQPAIPVTATIDGKPVATDTLIEVEPGEHVIHAEAEGFVPGDKKGIAIKGTPQVVDLELKPLPAHLVLHTEPGARVSVDGRGIGTTPVAAVEIAAGHHVLTIARNGRVAVSREISVARGQELRLDQPLTPTKQRQAVLWVTIGAGALAVITGTTALAAWAEDRSASSALDELHKGSQRPSVLADYRSAKDTRDQFVTGTWVTGTATLAVGAAAIFLYYLDTPSTEGLVVTPLVGSTSGGAAVVGRF